MLLSSDLGVTVIALGKGKKLSSILKALKKIEVQSSPSESFFRLPRAIETIQEEDSNFLEIFCLIKSWVMCNGRKCKIRVGG